MNTKTRTTTHTPGRWEVKGATVKIAGTFDVENRIAEFVKPEDRSIIAAAPEMLARLIEIEDLLLKISSGEIPIRAWSAQRTAELIGETIDAAIDAA